MTNSERVEAEVILGTIGAVLWSVQLIPQLVSRRPSATIYSAERFLSSTTLTRIRTPAA